MIYLFSKNGRIIVVIINRHFEMEDKEITDKYAFYRKMKEQYPI